MPGHRYDDITLVDFYHVIFYFVIFKNRLLNILKPLVITVAHMCIIFIKPMNSQWRYVYSYCTYMYMELCTYIRNYNLDKPLQYLNRFIVYTNFDIRSVRIYTHTHVYVYIYITKNLYKNLRVKIFHG